MIINGRIDIIVDNNKIRFESNLDPVIVCQVLLRVLGSTFEQKILQVSPNKLILTP